MATFARAALCALLVAFFLLLSGPRVNRGLAGVFLVFGLATWAGFSEPDEFLGETTDTQFTDPDPCPDFRLYRVVALTTGATEIPSNLSGVGQQGTQAVSLPLPGALVPSVPPMVTETGQIVLLTRDAVTSAPVLKFYTLDPFSVSDSLELAGTAVDGVPPVLTPGTGRGDSRLIAFSQMSGMVRLSVVAPETASLDTTIDLPGTLRPHAGATLSPDGTAFSLALSALKGGLDLHLLSFGSLEPVTLELDGDAPAGQAPGFSPDGQQIFVPLTDLAGTNLTVIDVAARGGLQLRRRIGLGDDFIPGLGMVVGINPPYPYVFLRPDDEEDDVVMQIITGLGFIDPYTPGGRILDRLLVNDGDFLLLALDRPDGETDRARQISLNPYSKLAADLLFDDATHASPVAWGLSPDETLLGVFGAPLDPNGPPEVCVLDISVLAPGVYQKSCIALPGELVPGVTPVFTPDDAFLLALTQQSGQAVVSLVDLANLNLLQLASAGGTGSAVEDAGLRISGEDGSLIQLTSDGGGDLLSLLQGLPEGQSVLPSSQGGGTVLDVLQHEGGGRGLALEATEQLFLPGQPVEP